MPELPSVCIMIPTFNQSGFIGRAVESALAQDYLNLSIVVADDCSTDGTAAVLKPYIDSGKIKYVRNPENLGRVANYHQCLYENTSAEWVINLDGDDYYTNPSFISQSMQTILETGREKVLFFQGSNIYKTAKSEELLLPRIIGQQVELSCSGYFFDFFNRRYFSHMSTLFNRSKALSSGFYEKDVMSSDIHSFLKCCLDNPDMKIILSRNVSGVWLQHETNTSKAVRFKPHWDNFGIYSSLYRLALRKGYPFARCFNWLLWAIYIYLRTYAGLFIRKIRQ